MVAIPVNQQSYAPAPPALPLVQTLDLSGLAKALTAAPNYAGLGKQARTEAGLEVGATVDALRAQQDALRAQAALRAQQINRATLAAANFDRGLNLAGHLGQSLRQAGLDQAALAQGFSGQARTLADQAAAEVNQNLAALGAPGQATNTSQQAANVLYAVGGQIPASVLTAYAPFAEAQARAVPAQLAAAGQQQAVSAIGQGAQQAASLNPDIAAAAAKLPSVTRSIYGDLVSQAQKSHQDAIGNLFRALDLQQKGYDAQAQRAYRQAQLDQHTSDQAAIAAYRTASLEQRSAYEQASLDQRAASADALAAYRAAQLAQQNAPQISGSLTTGIYRENPDGTITVLRKPQPKPAAAPKPTIRSGASPIVRVNPDGTVTTLYKPSAASTGKPYKIPTSVSGKALALAQRLHGDVGSGAGTLSLGGQTVTLGGSAGAPKPYREALRRVSAYLRAAGVPDRYVRQSAVQTLVAAGYQIPAPPQKPGPSIFDIAAGAASGLTGLAGQAATAAQSTPNILGG